MIKCMQLSKEMADQLNVSKHLFTKHTDQSYEPVSQWTSEQTMQSIDTNLHWRTSFHLCLLFSLSLTICFTCLGYCTSNSTVC